MVDAAEFLTLAFTSAGLFFFIGGTLGLLRFPDVLTRLHALTKADNLGLGLIVIGLAFQAETAWLALELILVWVLNNLAAATVSQLIARVALIGAQPKARRRD